MAGAAVFVAYHCDEHRWLDIINEWGFKKVFHKEFWSSFCTFDRMSAHSCDTCHPCPKSRFLLLLCAVCILIIYLQSLEAVGLLHSDICKAPADLESFQRNRVHTGTLPPTQAEDEVFCWFTKYTVFLFFFWPLTNNWPQEAAGPCPQRSSETVHVVG